MGAGCCFVERQGAGERRRKELFVPGGQTRTRGLATPPGRVCQPPKPKWTLSAKIGVLGVPDPGLARAGEWVGGDVSSYVPPLPLASRGALTPLPSPPGEGPSHPRRVSRFQLIQDFSVNYNRVWTPAPSPPLPSPLLPSPKCETLPKAPWSGEGASWSLGDS